jgi:uncharacterized membrane protein
MADDESDWDDEFEREDRHGDGLYETLRERIGGKEVLVPVAASAAAAAATWVARKGPDLLKELTGADAHEALGKASRAGGAKGFAAGAASKALQGGGSLGERLQRGGREALKEEPGVTGLAAKAFGKLSGASSGGRGWGKGRRLPILRSIDVAAPLEEVYEQWTNFDQFRTFMHRVEGVSREDGGVVWYENIWGRRRQWQAEITEQVKNQKLAWEITGGGQGSGVISFHKLAPRLTRIEVVFDWQPQGLVEKFASGLRFHKRAAKADLYRFKAFVETGGEKRGGAAGNDESRERTDGRQREQRQSRTGSASEREKARAQRAQHRRERRHTGARRS